MRYPTRDSGVTKQEIFQVNKELKGSLDTGGVIPLEIHELHRSLGVGRDIQVEI